MTEEEKRQRDDEELENLKLGYAALNDDYRTQLERLKTTDEKSNMLLVFNAAIFALLITVLPLNESVHAIYILSIITLTLFMASTVLTLSMIIVSIYPRKTKHLSHNTYTDHEFYHRSTIEFMGKVMAATRQSIESIHQTVEKKIFFTKVAVVLTFVNVALVWILIILNLL